MTQSMGMFDTVEPGAQTGPGDFYAGGAASPPGTRKALYHTDNGNGSVTEWYDDGSATTWRIDSGEVLANYAPGLLSQEMVGQQVPASQYPTQARDPWLSSAATAVGLPLNQPIPQGFTAPGATPGEAEANARAAMAGAAKPTPNLGPGRLPVPYAGQLKAGQYPATYKDFMGQMAQPGTTFPGGGVRDDGSRWFIGRDDLGGPLGWGQGYTDPFGIQHLGPASGSMVTSGQGNQIPVYYGAQPHAFSSGRQAGQQFAGMNVSLGSGGQGDPMTGPGISTALGWKWANPNRPFRGGGGDEDALATLDYDSGYALDAGANPDRGGGGRPTDLFYWQGNLTGDWTPLANLVGRSDTDSGISTAWDAFPDAYFQLLGQAIKQGVIKVNPGGWDFLKQRGMTPQSVGVDPNAVAGPGGAGAGGTGGTPGAPGSGNPNDPWGQYFNQQAEALKIQAAQQAAELAYKYEYMRLVNVPMAEADKQNAATQAATQAALAAYQQGQLSLSKQGLAGYMDNGQATMARQQMEGELKLAQQRIDEARRAGDMDRVQKETEFARNLAMQAMQLSATLRGPENAFQQQAVISGLNNLGVSNAVAAIAGTGGAVSQTGGIQAAPQGANLQTLANQFGQGAGSGGTFSFAQPGGQAAPQNAANPTQFGSFATPGIQTQADRTLSSMPAPNQVLGRRFLGLDEDTQKFLLSGYESLGYSPGQVQRTIQAGLPQFKAPTAGSMGA